MRMSSDAGRLSGCTTTIVLHGLSMLMATLILGFATQDAGLCSLGFNPFFAMLTMAYHTIILALTYINNIAHESNNSQSRCQKSSCSDHELHPLINPCIACLLCLAWLGAYIAMAVVLATRALVLPIPAMVVEDTLFKGNALVYNGHTTVYHFGTVQVAIPQTLRVNQKLQMFFSAVLCILLGDIAVRGVVEHVRADRGRRRVLA